MSKNILYKNTNSFIVPARKFIRESIHFINRCTKPTLDGMVYSYIYKYIFTLYIYIIHIDHTEFKKIAIVTSAGFLVVGIVGFAVKLVHIPSTLDAFVLFFFFLLVIYFITNRIIIPQSTQYSSGANKYKIKPSTMMNKFCECSRYN